MILVSIVRWCFEQHGHPYVSAMVSNGSQHYDHDSDGTHTSLNGCQANIRGQATETYVAIRYENNTLMVGACSQLLSHGSTGVFSLLHVFCLFVRLRISQRWKKIGVWNFACVFNYYPDRSSPLWWTLARGESRRRHYFRDVLSDADLHAGSCRGDARWGIWNWRQRHCLRPYSGICILQACWCTCFTSTLLIWWMVHWRDGAGNTVFLNGVTSNVFLLIRMH